MKANWSEDKVEVKGVHIDYPGELYFKKKGGGTYQTVHVKKNLVYSLVRYCCKSTSFPGLQQLIICITPVQKKSRTGHCCVVYCLNSELKDEKISVL